ncbi:MAG: hypothetical protein K2P58_15785 [Hyphomonadaceae bacterium]|nr:hypothetical protein [Hyphomonadaceae bacterium]
MKVRALVDGRTHEGSAVHEVRWIPNASPYGPDNTGRFQLRFKAEAPILDLTGRRLLFGVLGPPGDYPMRRGGFTIGSVQGVLFGLLPPVAFAEMDYSRGEPMGAVAALRGEFALDQRRWPLLVQFRDVADRSSARLVELQDFSSEYGEGARFLGASIEITDQPVTNEIEGRLPWLRSQRLAASRGPASYNASEFYHYHFKLEG